MIRIRIDGVPVPMPRPRAAVVNGHARVYNPSTAAAWKDAVMAAALPHRPRRPLACPLNVSIEFILPRPRSHFRTGRHAGKLKPSAPLWHTRGGGPGGGDRDNLDKAVLDALTRCGFWLDDGQVCAGSILKRYTMPSEQPGAVVEIVPIEAPGADGATG